MAIRRVPMARGEEQTTAPEGEYQLVITKVEAKKSKKGSDMDVLTLKFADDPEYASFRHYIVYPNEDTPEDQVLMRARELRRLCHVFDVPWTEEGIDSDDLLGAEGVCPVGVEVYEPEGKEPVNQNRLILPRLPQGD